MDNSWWKAFLMLLLLLLVAAGAYQALHQASRNHSDDSPANGPPPSPPPLPMFAGPPPPADAGTLFSAAPQVVVAADGTGNYTTISDAVAAAPSGSAELFVIYIKAGVYRENVRVPDEKTNIAFVGDGMNQTLLTSNWSASAGYNTEESATLAVMGEGFVARDMSIENSAGPGGAQAVALRSVSDRSAFYRLAIVGYQDTLFVERGRQFFRECDVYGTVDFVFGRASAVLQSCNLYGRQPILGQQIVFTAQSRESQDDAASGIVVHNCVLSAAGNLKPAGLIRGFLGRPWKPYSTTVVMQSYLGDIIDPSGWLEWNGSVGLDTLSYVEYQNRGPGAETSRRVHWPGLRVLTDPADAGGFTVSSFLGGDEWLPSTGIPYAGGLI